MTRLDEKLYREYITFFEKAEPWDKINKEASEDLALCAETFCSVEMYLPDYVAGGINAVRQYFGQAWFQANWAYEESKHSLVLMDYLVRSGKRSESQMFDLQSRIFDKKWALPFHTPRQMTFYGCVQEMATFVIYVKHRERRVPAHDLRLYRPRRDRPHALLSGRDQGAPRGGSAGDARRYGARVRALQDARRRPRSGLRFAHFEDA